jgi:MoxR-like ATPase
VLAQRHGHPLASLEAAVSSSELLQLRRAVEDVYVDDLIIGWIVDLVRATRSVEGLEVGASVRGSLMLDRTARAWALLQGRGHVLPSDVEQLFLPVLAHRLALTPAYAAETRSLDREEALAQVKERCLALAPPPAPDWDG